jgi:ABC-type lipopolysaccharide export system ATPase subunit
VASSCNLPVKSASNGIDVHRCSYLEETDVVVQHVIVPNQTVAPGLVAQIMDVIRNSKTLGITVLLVEQNAYAALRNADRGYVMETGRMTMQGPAEELIADERIRGAYLGL